MDEVCHHGYMFAETLGHSSGMDGRKRLARAFGEYVDDHRWSQAEVAAMGGPSTTTQTKVRLSDGPISRQTDRVARTKEGETDAHSADAGQKIREPGAGTSTRARPLGREPQPAPDPQPASPHPDQGLSR